MTTDRTGEQEPLAAVGETPKREKTRKATVGVPLARVIPRTLVRSPELIVLEGPRSYAAEKFRRMGSMLSSERFGDPSVVVVTSGAPGEGKSLVAVNLALTCSMNQDERTLLVDADLRQPGIERRVDPKPRLGLADILAGKATTEHVILELKDCELRILPAGKPPRNPMELLSSERMRNLMSELRQQYRRIIIDTPPIVPFADADVVGGVSDGFILVVRAGMTPVGVLTQALSLAASAPVLGTVLNGAAKNLADRRSSYDGYFHDYYSKKRKE
jgi:capsular exopolysaccharide synthesis family protein